MKSLKALRSCSSISSWCELELIASMEESNADSFSEGDLVFAQSKGYIPWPGKLVGKHSRHGLVDFLGTDDSRRILYSKIWPYCEDSKSRFITLENLEYPEFRDAIIIAEKLSSELGNDGACFYRVLSKEDLEEEPDQEEASQEEASEEEASQEDEEPGNEEPDNEEPGYEEPVDEEPGQTEQSCDERMCLKYVANVRGDRKSLEGGVEQKFIELVNVLRRSLKSNLQDYTSAVMALNELVGMELSEYLLVRNFAAVNSIYHLCYLNTDHVNHSEAAEVKLLARNLISRFATAVKLPDIESVFMDHFRGLSQVYRRFTYEFKPNQHQHGEEPMVWEEPDEEESGPEALPVEETSQEAMDAGYEEMPPTDDDSLNREVEKKFNQLVNKLRKSIDQKDYQAATGVLEDLLEMTFSKEFLLQKYRAVYLINDLCRYARLAPLKGLSKASTVGNLANKLMVRFWSVFQLPAMTTHEFMVHFCSLYTSDSESESDGE